MTQNELHLTGKHKRYLRGLGSTIDAIIQVGKGGVLPGVLQQLEDALEARELVKVRVLNNCLEDTADVAEAMAKQSGGTLVQVIGHTFLLYRPSVKNPRIELPK